MKTNVLNKLRVINADSEDAEIDFFDKTYYNDLKTKIKTVFEVTEEYSMSWGKISYRFYGTPDLAIELFKFNEYDNPFSLNVGDIIIIPDADQLRRNVIADISVNRYDDVLNVKTTIPNKQKDANRQEFLKKKQMYLPPSFAKTPAKRRNGDGTITLAD
jgi:hypothetical protein